MALLVAVLAGACVSPTVDAPPAAVATPGGASVQEAPRPNVTRHAPAVVTRCPLVALSGNASDLSQLQLFSRTLFYVRENHLQDVSPRARELLVAALEAVAAQDHEIAVERDPDTPPRWVTVTTNEQHCTLNIERVDAPWSLRSELAEALRFVQGHLAPAPPVDNEQRLMGIEIAATNGMLSALDQHSRLLEPETYRKIDARLRPPSSQKPAEANTLRVQGATIDIGPSREPAGVSFPRAVRDEAVGYLRLQSFRPGISGEVEHVLAASTGKSLKGFILDLRDNGGGALDEAVKVADAFIKEGTLGTVVGKRQQKALVAHSDGHEPTGALVVLVNRRTAAASEVVAAAVKNLGRGIVVGELTAGAGGIDVLFEIPITRRRRPPEDRDVVQNLIDGVKPPPPEREPLGEPFGLLLTTGRLLAAGGGEIDRTGVRPDVELEWADEQSRTGEDCVLRFAEALILQASDPRRSTLLSTAKGLPALGRCRPEGPSRP